MRWRGGSNSLTRRKCCPQRLTIGNTPTGHPDRSGRPRTVILGDDLTFLDETSIIPSVMPTMTRKQREMLQREELILDVATRMLLDRGYIGLNMDRVAEATEYSKGTIYQHFTCKEDIIAGVLLRTIRVRGELFGRAATFHGRSRERMTAVGVADELFYTLYPDHARIDQITKVESIWDKASQHRREMCHSADWSCMAVLEGIIRDGIASGDLVLPPNTAPESLMFGLWSMAEGARMLIDHGALIGKFGDGDPQLMLNRCFQIFVDGYGWKPLSSDWDYGQTVERVRREVFADDIRKAGARHG
jgi:AcrR family transcriptional regulator